jgi:2-polyprenyl-6-methoxyphenol hydroxylase-like FAD-dependent oxidoreductase
VPETWPVETFDLSSPVKVRADRILPHAIYALPVGHHWQNRTGLTLLGDAAHVMAPFGGAGVNNAMLDATELARALIEDDDWQTAVATYEHEIFARVVTSADFAAEGVALGTRRPRSHGGDYPTAS